MQEVETTCERVLVINRGRLVADSPVEDLLKLAPDLRKVRVEIEGSEIETGLNSLDSISSVERQDSVGNRKRYTVNLTGRSDPRPEIFTLAIEKGWVIWDLHEEQMRLEDVFHSLTALDEVKRSNQTQ